MTPMVMGDSVGALPVAAADPVVELLVAPLVAWLLPHAARLAASRIPIAAIPLRFFVRPWGADDGSTCFCDG
jgi:hypothetical protein